MQKSQQVEKHDVVVVGGGSAGCVLAARLSENVARRVLLIEAGPDYGSTPPAEVADGRQPAYSHDWGYASQPDASGRCIELPRARVVGGCSATNAGIALRGSPVDYDGWAALGNPGWAFEDVLPYFRAAESDADFDDEWHGRSGPLPIRRYPPAEMSACSAGLLDAAAASGIPAVADHNRPFAVGTGPAPTNVKDGIRMSSALTYLAAARARPNLSIRAGVVVDRVQSEHGQVIGVRLAGGELVEAGTVVLAAGAYGSPSILLRSGIGPPGELAPLGIRPLVPLDGVGRNLMDHPITSVDFPVRGPVWEGPLFQVVMTLHSQGRDRAHAPDLQIFPSGPWASGSERILALVLSVLKPLSRGSLRLRAPDPEAAPLIEIGHLRDPSDRARMSELIRIARNLWRQPALAAVGAGQEVGPGSRVGDSGPELEAWAVSSAVSCHHPSGTCGMGPDPDQGAVVDAAGKVYGVEGIYVADASVMPEIPSANTNVPTIMVAERVAAILAGRA